MTARGIDQPQPPAGEAAPAASQPGGNEAASPVVRALPEGEPRWDSGQPGGGRGRIDVTGIIPEEIRIDPNITEGHPGYEESGDSGIMPPARRAGGGTAAEEGRGS
jgi:hypothetical protein